MNDISWESMSNQLFNRSKMNHAQGKTISIYFSDYELSLLNRFNELCQKTYSTKTGWVKRKIYEELKNRKIIEQVYENN